MNRKLIFIQKPVYNVYNSIINKHEKLETILSFYWWMDKQTIVHPNNGAPLSEKKGTNLWYMQGYGWISNALC